jgi:hypothetical protein
LPEIDANIFGECQSLLLNLDNYLEKEFGSKYCIRESLSFSLQLFPSKESLTRALKSNTNVKDLMLFIQNYRTSMSSEILDSSSYSFKAFLIQVANHKNADALPIQFLQYDKLSDEEKEIAQKFVAMVKYRQGESSIMNENLLKPSEVVHKVQIGLGDRKVDKNGKKVDFFNMTSHSKCWKKYQVRPERNSKTPSKTRKEYCIYDKVHNDYVYKEEWVNYLISELKKEISYSENKPPEDLVLH